MYIPPDIEIIERLKEITLAIRSGSKEIFKSVYLAEYNNLVHFINSYLRNKQDSEDLAQETMLESENRETLDPNKNFRSYLYAIAGNKSLNYLGQCKAP